MHKINMHNETATNANEQNIASTQENSICALQFTAFPFFHRDNLYPDYMHISLNTIQISFACFMNFL